LFLVLLIAVVVRRRSVLMMGMMVGGTKEWAEAWRIENQQRHVIWARFFFYKVIRAHPQQIT
jgi:hypothetical protein